MTKLCNNIKRYTPLAIPEKKARKKELQRPTDINDDEDDNGCGDIHDRKNPLNQLSMGSHPVACTCLMQCHLSCV